MTKTTSKEVIKIMDDNNTEKTKKENKKLARSAKNSAKKTTKGAGGKTDTDKAKKMNAKASSLVNEGKCCRCSFRDSEKKCSCKKSANNGKYVARKSGCENFKYN